MKQTLHPAALWNLSMVPIAGRLAALLLFLALSSFSASAQMKKPPLQICESDRMMRFAYEGKLDRALVEAETCLAAARKEAVANEPTRGKSCGLMGSNPAGMLCGILDIPMIGHYFSAKVQLLAMMGSPGDASSAFRQYEELNNYYPEYSQPDGILTPGWVANYQLAKGMLMESEGRPDDARQAYSQCQQFDPRCIGRLASLALRQGQGSAALIWSRKGSVFHDASSLAILAALKEKQGSDTEAFLYYSDAEKLIRDALGKYAHMPVEVAEQSRVALGLARVGASAPKVIESDGKRRYLDVNGQLAGWERWPHVMYSEKVKEKQDGYNLFLRASNLPVSLALKPQYPRFFLGFTADQRKNLKAQGFELPAADGYPVPEWIEPTGVLDLDTLAIPFYEDVVEISKFASKNRISVRDLEASAAPSSTSSFVLELRHAYAALDSLHGFLAAVGMKTSAGASTNAAAEARRYVPFREASKDINFDDPPDFVTAHLDGADLTPAFVGQLQNYEAAVRVHLDAARQLLPATPSPQRAVH